MSTQITALRPSLPAIRPGGTRGLIRFVCTSNPFYVLSAGLFLAGLWISFGTQVDIAETSALMSGLAGYTLLLALTACLLVRFGGVWDDVRTVLLLVVLMFLATSVTFDYLLVMDSPRGTTCCLIGLAFAVSVSEGLLRGTRLKLHALFRAPYYAILALFFLYPIGLSQLTRDPHGETLMWALFSFSSVTGLVFLSLLPAIRQGPDYVRDNGSPWHWPLYPWTLFGLLALAVPARAVLFCYSMQHLAGSEGDQLLFGPFFIVPFGLVVAVLLLEIGIVASRTGALLTALTVPAGLVLFLMVGHRDDPMYRRFLELVSFRADIDPLSLLLLASACFYAYAARRRVPLALAALTAALVALAVVDRYTLETNDLGTPRAVPLFVAGMLQLVLGRVRRSTWHFLLGGALTGCSVLALPLGPGAALLRGVIAYHLVLTGVLILGAVFDDTLARLLRLAGAVLILHASVMAMVASWQDRSDIPVYLLAVYPLVLAGIAAGYGSYLRHRPSLVVAGVVLLGWLGAVGLRGYIVLRPFIAGLDYITLSIVLFVVAVGISLYKAGLLARWLPLPSLELRLDATGGEHSAAIQCEAPAAPLTLGEEKPGSR